MQVFLCWSGSRSLKLAEILRDFLLKGWSIDCFISAYGITKGEFWFERVRQELAKSDCGIICLTPENLESRWMHFEAGSLLGAKEAKKIYTYYLDENPADVKDPFKSLQITVSTKEDTQRLLAALVGREIDTTDAEKFNDRWPDFSKEIARLRVPRVDDLIPGFDRLFQRKSFEEHLEECSDQAWLDRFLGVQQTIWTLQGSTGLIERFCQPFQIWLYHRLLGQLDGYARELRGFLLGEREFKLHLSGERAGHVDFTEGGQFPETSIPSNLNVAVERRCRNIRGLVFMLMWHAAEPVHKEALQFERLQPSEFFERKTLIRSVPPGNIDDRCRRSYWQFDRILYYLNHLSADLGEQSKWVTEEVERARAAGPGSSEMPLHYAMRSLWAAFAKQSPTSETLASIDRAAKEMRDFLTESGRNERPVEANLKRIEERLQVLAVRAKASSPTAIDDSQSAAAG
jgi:hypothetical protein